MSAILGICWCVIANRNCPASQLFFANDWDETCLSRKLGPSWHFLLKPFDLVSFHVMTRKQVLHISPQQCYTLYNAHVCANAMVYMQMHDVISVR